jgi:hypothetical protein
VTLLDESFCKSMTVQDIKRVLVCCLLLGMVVRVPAAEYEVDGQLEQTIYKWDGSVATLQKSQFTIFVRDCSWLIRTTQSNTNGKPVAASETACVNGTEIYEVAGRADNGNQGAGQRSQSMNMATVVSNNLPVGERDGYFVCHLWLMFASGCYFQNRTNHWLTPVYDSNASVDVKPYLEAKARWELIDGPGSLPTNIVYYDYLNYASSSIDATYTATGVTNAGTIKIPSGFVFERRIYGGFLPGPIQPGKTFPDYGISKRAVATVTAVRPVCSRRDLAPTAKGKTMVIDKRVWQDPSSKVPVTVLKRYMVEDGVQWLPFAKAKKAYVVPHLQPKPVSRGIIFAILLLPTALFASLWLLTRKRT